MSIRVDGAGSNDPKNIIKNFFEGTNNVSGEELREALRKYGRQAVDNEAKNPDQADELSTKLEPKEKAIFDSYCKQIKNGTLDTEELFRKLGAGEISHTLYTAILSESVKDINFDE